MNIHLADSLEEFDLRYIESCNQCFYIEEDDGFRSRGNSLSSSTNKLTLSSPLLANKGEFSSIAKAETNFAIFNDIKPDKDGKNMPPFKRPPLKPSKFSEKKTYKGNPFYKPPAPLKQFESESSPTKKRKVSADHSISSYESLLSLSRRDPVDDSSDN